MGNYITKDVITALIIIILCLAVYYILKEMLSRHLKIKNWIIERKTVVSIITNIINIHLF